MTDIPPSRDVPRRFVFDRQQDVSGISGTGEVAEAVYWSDGEIALHWRGKWPATTVWTHGLNALMAIHGHKGKTQIRWIDTPPGSAWDQHDDPTIPHPPPRGGP